MNPSDFKHLLEQSWQRPLNAEENARLEAWLAQHPETHRLWDEEARLNRLLQEMPDVPVPSNFTQQVVQAVDAAERSDTRDAHAPLTWAERFHAWWPRVAGVGLLVVAGYAAVQVWSPTDQERMAEAIKFTDKLAKVPHTEALQDFDTIQKLSASLPDVAMVDMELLAALK